MGVSVWTFIHYHQQIQHVLRLKPRRMLEIGPGNQTVAHVLRGRGVVVKTFDIDPSLNPDYVGDVRENLGIEESFDVVLASEVFEHMNIRWLDTVLENVKKVVADSGWLVVSLPYSTIRLFPERSMGRERYGRIVSDEGRLYTHIPYYLVQPILTFVRGIYRIAAKRRLGNAFECYRLREHANERTDIHHWDLGWYPTTRKAVRKIFARHFRLVEEKAYVNTNCVFFILKKD